MEENQVIFSVTILRRFYHTFLLFKVNVKVPKNVINSSIFKTFFLI